MGKRGMPSFVNSKRTKYKIGDTLGKGAFGIVKLATDVSTGETYAAKAIDLNIVERDHLEAYVEREGAMSRRLNHPHIIKLVEIVELKDWCLRFYIMELAPNGELFDQIVAVNKFPEQTARRYFRQLMAAVRYCHNQGVCHRDLKAENLLLSKDNTLKICDFGLCGQETTYDSVAGSLDYQAPEILRHMRYEGKPADVWACGVILSFMLSGYLPFQEANQQMTEKKILAKPPDVTMHDDVSPGARDLIMQCLTRDPQSRISATGIISHPWFREGLDVKLCNELKLPLSCLASDDDCQAPLSPLSPVLPRQLTGTDSDIENERFNGVDKSLLRKLRVAFDAIDVNHSGSIQEDELRDILIKLNSAGGQTWIPSDHDVHTLRAFFSKDEDITFEDFVVGFVEKKVETSCTLGQRLRLQDLLGVIGGFDVGSLGNEYVTSLRSAFNHIDEDKSGVIHRDELSNLLERANIIVSDAEKDQLFGYMDSGKQDFITFEEFAAAWVAHESTQPNSPVEGGISRTMSRIRKCSELIDLAEIDEAHKVLSKASLGITMKGSREDIFTLALDTFNSIQHVTCAPSNQSLSKLGLQVRYQIDGKTLCEARVLILRAMTGYSTISTRRCTGGTVSFHKIYKNFSSIIETTSEYVAAKNELEEEGEVQYL
eukprot:TRINITY_DN5098_c5_g1_i1.p1 TRINITY_DN5098_c5_g1~~TRINITY_DN5098_c5_g1_i1.p1  ORF type:complete len:657 (+),score=106.55 TRINITY_DN5098_c5_g1_i1:14-1984(+)